ncbi:hypothetical protein BH09SUM1_BH09SUM1_27710 [soil metagenome]
MSITLDLSPEVLEFIQEQSEVCKLAGAQDYILDLIKRDRAKKELKALAIQGLESGPAEDFTDAEWDELGRIVTDAEANGAK